MGKMQVEVKIGRKMRKLVLLNESLVLIERLRKMRAVGVSSRIVGVAPNIRNVNWLYK